MARGQKTGGRNKGTPNKVTKEIREVYQELLEKNLNNIDTWLQKVAKDNRLQMIFDKSGELVLIYTDPIHDYTDYVLEELGLGDNNDVIK